MKDYKIILISFVLLIFMIGAVSATDEGNALADDDPGAFIPDDTIIVVDDDEGGDIEHDIKEIYVNDTGDDSNSGTAESPYASIDRALSDVNSSDYATIHISEGTFFLEGKTEHHVIDYGGWVDEWDEEYNGLYINLDHDSFGGTLKFLGAGVDKTFIDGQSACYFATIENSNVFIQDITFINCKNSNIGGVITNYGNLTVDNCVFDNSFADYRGGAIYAKGDSYWMWDDELEIDYEVKIEPSVTVLNSQFISNKVNSYERWGETSGGGAIYVVMGNLYLENNTFINNSISKESGAGFAVYSINGKSTLINNEFVNISGFNYDASIYVAPGSENEAVIIENEFINCTNPSETYSIVYLGYGKTTFERNTFKNSSNSAGNIYAYTSLNNLKFEMEDVVINISNTEVNNGVVIPITNITDDMGNIVKTTNYDFKFTGETVNYTYYPIVKGNVTSIKFSTVPENGIYNLTILSGDSTTDVLTTVNISTSNDPAHLYVSPKGSDAQNGTIEYPFETIQHAIDVGFEKSFTVIVHLLKGTYSGEGNVALTIANKGSLQILGEEYGEVIIDGNNDAGFLYVSTTGATFENLTFINGQSTSGHLISGGILKNCIVKNNTVDDCDYYVMQGTIFENLTYINNYGRIMVYNSFSNSFFANNRFEDLNYGGIILLEFDGIVVENCYFINNTATFAGVIQSYDGFTSRNNYYGNNKASDVYATQRSDSQDCGVISMGNSGTYTFENDTFENNHARESGVIGWSYLNNEVSRTPILIATDCKFINNSAAEGGVTKIKVGTFTNCEFINNTADYGGAISLLPYVKSASSSPIIGPIIGPIIIPGDNEDVKALILEDVTFKGNTAKYTGNDIYLAPKTSWYSGNNYAYPIDLTISFNDLNTSCLVDDLVVNVSAPCDAQVGGSNVNFILNDNNVGSAEIINGIATLSYAGFDDGVYNLSGYMDFQSENTIVNNATVNVKLEGILDNVTYFVSNNGSDENGNGSEDNPFKSISYAIKEASKNCRNIVINIAEGTYVGDLNTALTLSAMNNITLAGKGIDETVIDGENNTYFAIITEGKSKISISDLTIKNMLPDNRASKVIEVVPPITIEQGASLLLNNVAVVDNHGGKAIIVNDGNLEIYNSVFERNGIATWGIVCGNTNKNQPFGGNVIINNTIFENNYAQSSLISGNNIIINNSVISNSYNVIRNAGLDLINRGSNSQGNVTIENTIISNDGSLEDLNSLGVTTDGLNVNPALCVNGNTYMVNSSMVNDFNGTLRTSDSVASLSFAAAFGYTYTVPRNVTVVNSSFINYQYLWMATTYDIHNFIFDGCVFENLDYIAWIRTNNENSNYNITNSVFLNCTNVINQKHYTQMATPKHVNLNDNYWGNNNKTIVYFLANNGIKDDVVDPDTWIVLYSEDNQTVIKNITDGENSTAYIGNAPIRADYADDNGKLGYAVVFDDIGYLFTTDNETNVIFNIENPIYPFEAADPMDYRTPTNIAIIGFEGDKNVIAMLVDIVGNPIANATITSTFTGMDAVNTTTDENGTFTVKAGKDGILCIVFAGDDTYFDDEYDLKFVNAGKTAKTFINFIEVDGELVITGTLTDDEGTPITSALVSYVVNGNTTGNATTDANGTFKVQGESNAVIDVAFAGNDIFDAVNATITLKDLAATRMATEIKADDFTQYAIDVKAGEKGGYFKAQLVDASGNPMVNKTVQIGFNGVVYTKITNESGWVQLQINLAKAGEYTFAVVFLGDGDYNASFVVKKITVNKKKTSIDASAKSFKSSVKTKKYTVTLKTDKGSSVDGKTYLRSGKKITLTVGGTTYTAKTNANGQATFKITKLSKKGKFTATVKFDGDDGYLASSKTAKITIK